METLLINVDNAEHADELIKRLNEVDYVKSIEWTPMQKTQHLLTGTPLSDSELNLLLDEAEEDAETYTLEETSKKLNEKFKASWMSNLGEGRI